MRHREGLTLIELIVVIIVIVFLLALLMPPFGQEKRNRTARRVICGANLKGLGTAIAVYANDYENRNPQLPGIGPWAKELGFSYNLAKPDFSEGMQHNVGRTISASWYLLVREADVSPKSFVCRGKGLPYIAFDESIPGNLDLVELWDFGPDPYRHVSYAMHLPYGKYPADDSRTTGFAVAADMNPWMKDGDFVTPPVSITKKDWKDKVYFVGKYWDTQSNQDSKWEIQRANAFAHNREGQNVLYGDGHANYEKESDVGVKHDNIYTYWSSGDGAKEEDRRVGANPTARDETNDAKSGDDSFLVI